MTSRSAATIMHTADPAADVPVDDAWADAEGRATYERIVADDRSTPVITLPRRRYRRRLALGVALAASAGAVVAVVGIPGSANHGGAAWAVTRNSDGSVTVAFTDYRDPAQLQGKLRDAGLRANVRTLAAQCSASRTTYKEFVMSFDSSISHTAFGRLLGIPVAKVTIKPPSPPNAPQTPRLGQPPSAPSAPQPSSPSPARPHVLSSLTVHPQFLPSAATLWVGFPPEGAASAGHLLTVAVASTGSGAPACF